VSDAELKFTWAPSRNGRNALCRTEAGRVVGGIRQTNAGDYIWQCTVLGATVSDTEEEEAVARSRVETSARAALEAL
jgi:hypothetical protein